MGYEHNVENISAGAKRYMLGEKLLQAQRVPKHI
jgi:hypothetical protein